MYFTGFPAPREGRNLDMNLEEYLVAEHITPFLFLLLKNDFFFIFARINLSQISDPSLVEVKHEEGIERSSKSWDVM